jgi:two-component system, OmpR family, sensor kinase
MARDAAGIQQAQDLSRRVAVPRTGDEVADLGQTFNGMLGRLEAVFDAQRRFIADASHELRTPLTAIRGNADLLRYHDERMDSTERAEVLDDMATEAERMSRLIGDLLALARAQTGEQPRPAPARFDEAVDGAVRAARGLARGHEITYASAGTPLWVMGDADRLKQLALILLDNAVKYTPPEGHIWAIVRQERGMVELRVMDNGPGIPPERLPHLFDRFYRGGTLARGRDDGGAGLGLAIAREIAQGYGGSIAVESTVGQGTAFTVQFPLLTPVEAYRPADLPTSSVPTPIATSSQTETD